MQIFSTGGAAVALAAPSHPALDPGFDACLTEYMATGRLLRVVEDAVTDGADELRVWHRLEPLSVILWHHSVYCAEDREQNVTF